MYNAALLVADTMPHYKVPSHLEIRAVKDANSMGSLMTPESLPLYSPFQSSLA
jgi:hypothetical protein